MLTILLDMLGMNQVNVSSSEGGSGGVGVGVGGVSGGVGVEYQYPIESVGVDEGDHTHTHTHTHEEYDYTSGSGGVGNGNGEEGLKLFIGQIPRHMDEDDLRPYFVEFGHIVELTVIRDKSTKVHRGCAFLTYARKQSAINAIEALHDIVKLPNAVNPLQIRPAESQAERENKIFVGMLPKTITEIILHDMFARFGQLKEIHIIRGPEGHSKGCAFVKFINRDAAVLAIHEMHDTVPEGSTRPLVIKFADSKKGNQRGQDGYGDDEGGDYGMGGGMGGGHYMQQQQYGHHAPHQMQHMQQHGGAGRHHGNFLHDQSMMNMYPAPPSPMGSPVQSHPPYMYFTSPGQQHLYSHQHQNHHQYDASRSAPDASHTGGDISKKDNEGRRKGSPSGEDGSGWVDEQGTDSNVSRMPYRNAGDDELDMDGQQSQSTSKPAEGPSGANLFIYHLPRDLTDADLATLFAEFGNVVSAKVYVDKKTAESKGFGFVSYDVVHSAEAAIAEMVSSLQLFVLIFSMMMANTKICTYCAIDDNIHRYERIYFYLPTPYPAVYFVDECSQ